MQTVQELLDQAEKPGRDAMRLHPFYRGKIETVPKCCIRDFDDFGIWYSPGVAQPCLDIQAHPETVFDHTNKANFVAVITDGTRVLGLGDIGPEAALPVMEGKALLYKYLGGVDAFPICLDTKDPDKIVETILLLQPTFAGVNLEDISHPKCFDILNAAREKARIPVWHDDQQGTATVVLAGLINALKIVNKKMGEVRVAMAGAGASGVRTAWLMVAAGVRPENIIMCDSKGTLHRERTDLQAGFKQKWELAQATNADALKGDLPDAMKGADVLIGLSRPGPDTVKKEWIAGMAPDPIVFACANPVPEIFPWDAKEAGARIFATGRSDFPNQINNSLGFPGIFRGTLDVRARTITDEMCIAAAREIAQCAEDKGIHEEHIIPTMDEWEVFPREAVAVGLKAIEQGVAGIELGEKELYEIASSRIRRARESAGVLMQEGIIKMP